MHSDIINLSFNIDGLPIFNNSNKQVWPILGLIKNVNTISKPFPIGIFYGISKPQPIDIYLEDFVNELSQLIENGIVFNKKKYVITVHSFICDAPAKAFVKCIKGHAGYSSCDKCTEVGVYINGRMIFPNLTAPTRTDEGFRTKEDTDHHSGTSPLLQLNFDMIRCFPIDYMHCICLGIVKKLLISWISGNIYNVRLNMRKITTIDNHLKKLIPFFTVDFNRKIETLSNIAH